MNSNIQQSIFSDPIYKIYLSRFLSSWGDRCWSFAVGLYLVILYQDSLALTAIFGLSTCISIITFGVFVGKWIDNTKRITIAKSSLIVQNGSVAASAGILIIMIHYKDYIKLQWNGHLDDFLLVLFILFAIFGELSSVATRINVEKDWIVILSEGDESKLARMNSTTRTINLATFILAPIAVGQLLTYWSPIGGAAFVCIWNVISGFFEYQLLKYIYRHVPRLETKISLKTCKKFEIPELQETSWRQAFNGWGDYYRHQVRNAGFGLAATYMSVLAFDNITTGHLYHEGLSESLVSIVTAISAVFGILGSLSFPLLRNSIGTLKTGLIGFGVLMLTTLICVVSIWTDGSPFQNKNINLVPIITNNTTGRIEFWNISELFDGNHTYILVLISGLILMRYGQWMSDLSVTQIMQENIEESKRGIINAVQDSLNQFLNFLKYFLVLCMPRNESFGFLIILTWIFTLIGFLSFGSYAYKENVAKIEMKSMDEKYWLLKEMREKDKNSNDCDF